MNNLPGILYCNENMLLYDYWTKVNSNGKYNKSTIETMGVLGPKSMALVKGSG